MRLPVAGTISTKDGTSNKNARMTNMLINQKKDVAKACVRPALASKVTGYGAGNGIVCFNDEIVTLSGEELTAGITVTPGTTSFVKHDDVLPKQVGQLIKNGNVWYAFLNHQELDHATIGGVWYSSDLASWTEITSTRGYEIWGTALIVGTDIKFAAFHWTYDEDESIDVADTKHTITITSGGSLSIASSSDTYYFYPLLYVSGTYYGVAQNPPGTYLFATSTDMNSVTLGDNYPDTYNTGYRQMHYGGGKFWFAGSHSSPNYVDTMYSDDGLNWSTPYTISTYSGYAYSAYGLGKFAVLVYPDLICYTEDGISFDTAIVADAPAGTGKWLIFNSEDEKFYYISSFVNPTPAFFLSESPDIENWTDITPSGGDQISINGYGQNGTAVVIGVGKGTAYPYDYGVYEISQTDDVSTLTSFDNLPDAAVDFALMP